MKERDHFYWKAKSEGYASRAAYKLQEIQKSQKLFNPGDIVLELGAAPGGWTEIMAPFVGKDGQIIGIDLNPMESRPLGNVTFIQGDFTDPLILRQAHMAAGGLVDVVVSDALPSTSGIGFRDAARSAELCLAALAVCGVMLKNGGHFLCKVFAGEEQDFLSACAGRFIEVKRLKPEASKKKSREFYLLALSHNPR